MKHLALPAPYRSFLASPAARQWKKIGTARRAGVAVPLFSIYSSRSVGIGELPDLKLLAQWCRSARMSVIQLLPLNDVGFDFKPYDAQSAFALEPLYVSLTELRAASAKSFARDIALLRKRFPTASPRVNYALKGAKLGILEKIFKSCRHKLPPAFKRFVESNRHWLKDYALFRTIKDREGEKSWEAWPAELRERDKQALGALEKGQAEQIQFHEWVQWQLYEQLRDAKAAARKKQVLLMGDLPFLISRDSADVWAHQDDYRLDLASGAPPDMYQAKGQRWGMPPYNWQRTAERGYSAITQKFAYAENFYDLIRIDHVAGMFRLWTIPVSEPIENAGLNGAFDPRDESRWEAHGRTLLSAILDATSMLPCAEDLGVVPACCFDVLAEFALPGADVQRWSKDWGGTYAFKSPEAYRRNATAVIATHDMSIFRAWWEHEAGTVDEGDFRKKCAAAGIALESVTARLFDPKRSRHGRLAWRAQVKTENLLLEALGLGQAEAHELLDLYRSSFGERERFWALLGRTGKPSRICTPKLVRAALAQASASACIFSIQLLSDYLSLIPDFPANTWAFRINFPGTSGPQNWSLRMPYSLEALRTVSLKKTLRKIHTETQRI